MQWLLTWVHVASSGQRPRRSPETCHGTSEASWAPASSATSLRPVGARPASLRPDWPAHPLAAQREAARHLGGAYMNLMHPTGKRAPRLESPREKALRRGAYTRPWLAGRLWRFPTKGSRPTTLDISLPLLPPPCTSTAPSGRAAEWRQSQAWKRNDKKKRTSHPGGRYLILVVLGDHCSLSAAPIHPQPPRFSILKPFPTLPHPPSPPSPSLVLPVYLYNILSTTPPQQSPSPLRTFPSPPPRTFPTP